MNRALLAAALQNKWAIRREAIPLILAAVRADLAGPASDAAAEAQRAGLYDRQGTGASGPVAVIRVLGGISHRDTWYSSFFGTTVERFKGQFRTAINDDAVTAIVLDVDSPGGVVDGVPEIATEVFKSRGRKPILAVSNTLMCSAAYWIGAQADEIVVSPSSTTGSIGVYALHEEISQMLDAMGVKISLIFAGDHKVDGNPFEPLSDTARADIQASIDDTYTDFLSAVAKGRGTTASDVRKTYGQGLCYSARDSVKLGLADRVATFDDVVAKLVGRKGTAGVRVSTSGFVDASAPAVETRKTGPGSRQDGGCQDCSEACACDQEQNCPAGCSDCDQDCACQCTKEAAATDTAATLAADNDAAAAAVQIAERL